MSDPDVTLMDPETDPYPSLQQQTEIQIRLKFGSSQEVAQERWVQ
jgi:hypothetical protein